MENDDVPPPQAQQDQTVTAWAALLRVHAALVPRMDRELLRATGLSLSQYDVLLELYHADRQRLRMANLAERTVVSRSRVSRIVDDLTARGMTTREADTTDGRVAHAVITDRGRDALRAAWPIYRAAILRLVGVPLGDDAGTVADALGRVRDALGDPQA
jgi:DNA-binding MarR family transcriptional regulator